MENYNLPGFNIFDGHAHYDDDAFKDDLSEVITSIKENGVIGVINAGIDYSSSETLIALSKKYDIFYTAVGVHPENLYPDKSLDTEKMQSLINCNKVVAIGEIGLDYHWNLFDPEIQKKWFVDQIDFANSVCLPVIVHDRDAHFDTMNILKQTKPKGIIHCFSGSAEMAAEALKLGLYIGVGGVVTFKNAKKSVEVVKTVPINRIIFETDAPYLSPQPQRGKRCRSDYIYYTAAKVAEIKGMPTDEVLKASRENIKELYGI